MTPVPLPEGRPYTHTKLAIPCKYPPHFRDDTSPRHDRIAIAAGFLEIPVANATKLRRMQTIWPGQLTRFGKILLWIVKTNRSTIQKVSLSTNPSHPTPITDAESTLSIIDVFSFDPSKNARRQRSIHITTNEKTNEHATTG